MAIEYNFTLDMDRSKRDNNIAYARTGDIDSIVINADLVFDGAAYTPSGENAFFECITPNGRSIRSAAEKTGSSVTVEVPPAAFQAAGVINVAYFRFESGETGNPTYVESTEPFAIVVREGIGDALDAGDYIEEWRKLVDHLEVVVADVGQKAEQVEIAKAAAEKAKVDAETAGTAAANSASEAKSSATAAQQSATAAAQSAASVADKYITSAQATTLDPGSQATASVENQVLTIGVPKGDKGEVGPQGPKGDTGPGVPDGGTPGQLLSKTDSGTAWVDPPSTGNVLTGTAEGYVAHAEDAYAVKPREVRVKGRTVMKNLWVNPSGTSNGITVTANEDGSITISGTSMANFYIYSTIYSLKPGSTYTLSIDKTVNASISIQPYDNSDGFIINVAEIGHNGASKNTGVFPSNAAYARLRIQCPPGTSLSGTYRIMLNEGSEPEPWCPPGLYSVETGKLVTAGKNLISFGPDTPKKTSNKNINDGDILVGVTTSGYVYPNSITGLEVNDGSITATSSSSGYGVGFVRYLPKGTTFTVSGKVTGNGRVTFTYVSHDKIVVNRASYGESDTTTTGKVPSDCVGIVVLVRNALDGYPVSFTAIPQLELGSTATPYEPPNITQTALPEVELRSLSNGTCDELVIKEDGTCEVERKIGEAVIDAEHPASISVLIPASGDNLPYAIVSNVLQPFDSSNVELASTEMYSTTWPRTPNLKSRGVYRTWNSIIFVDERFTDKETAQSIINETGGTFVAQVPSSTEPQSPVTLPALPAPTFNQYHDSPVPSDTSTEYVRDINIVIDNLAKQIAGTAATVAINEATR